MNSSSYLKGFAGFLVLFGVYFLVVTLLSGWGFAVSQFFTNWYWFLALASGFGIQVGIFSELRRVHREKMAVSTVATTGTTSGLVMLSCCAHYLTNFLPILGISGLAALVGQYQNEIFGFGVASNLVGIGYLVRQGRKNEI
ncbi:MAG: hypothetical protein UY40_C0023G0003 [candidate division CPR1 bacterium GW2011_GWC1_49_13]|uniref:Uncharacterized protein n=1 Tax=candidate division CPR1 bacterium GW2011_GWC1_49_13 TaxID=1618342 RepID=A0A0G1VFL1_9BACT|nr:MAG: hypothetical protein UY40_C0023G0003 [candidate division CPR1 bacterium GW2011_GWC1_49_13]